MGQKGEAERWRDSEWVCGTERVAGRKVERGADRDVSTHRKHMGRIQVECGSEQGGEAKLEWSFWGSQSFCCRDKVHVGMKGSSMLFQFISFLPSNEVNIK